MIVGQSIPLVDCHLSVVRIEEAEGQDGEGEAGDDPRNDGRGAVLRVEFEE